MDQYGETRYGEEIYGGPQPIIRDVTGHTRPSEGAVFNLNFGGSEGTQYGQAKHGEFRYGDTKELSRRVVGHTQPVAGESTRGGATYARSVEGHSASVVGNVATTRSLVRSSEGFTASVQGDTGRTSRLLRYPSTDVLSDPKHGEGKYGRSQYGGGEPLRDFGYMERFVGEIDRDPMTYVDRSVTGWSEPSYGVPRILTTTTGYVQQIDGENSRTIARITSITGYTDPFSGSVRRFVGLVPEVDGYTEEVHGAVERSVHRFTSVTGWTGEMWGVAGLPNWRIGGKSAKEFVTELRDWQKLVLQFRANRNQLETTFRPLNSGAGKFGVIEYPDGSYTTVDRSDGDAKVEAVAPIGRESLRSTKDFLIEEYEESVANQKQQIYDVELTLFAEEPKDSVNGERLEPSDTEWHFSFADGDVLTGRVEKDIGRGGSTIDGRVTVKMIVTEAEAIIIEGSLNRQAATRIMEVPDGGDKRQDKNPDERNSVTVTTPSQRDPDERTIESGEYVVQGWENQHLNDEFFEITLTMGEKF